MRLEGSDSIRAPRDRVWAFLADPQQVAGCLPGIDRIDAVDATHFTVTTVEVSAVRAKATVKVERSEVRAPEHLAFLANGQARGLSVAAKAEVNLRPGQEVDTTILGWSVDVETTGPLAAVGTRMIDRSARSLITQTLRCMNTRLGGASPAGASEFATTGADVMRFDPNWCLFWGLNVSSNQLDIWIPYVKRSRHRFAIVTPGTIRPADRERIAALQNAIIVEPFEHGLEWLRACRSFRGFLYVGTRPANFQVVNRNGRQAHVFIGHGDSGKGTSSFRTGSLYDSVFVADYSAVRRFPRSIRPWVWRGAIAIGTAVVEGVRKDAWIHPRQVKTILYAPTWEGNARNDYTSLDEVAPVLRSLLPALAARGIEVIMRPHPVTGARRPELKAILEALRTAGVVSGVSKAEAFERADVLISDVSGVTAEFLLTEKPSVIPIGLGPGMGQRRGRRRPPGIMGDASIGP